MLILGKVQHTLLEDYFFRYKPNTRYFTPE